MLCIYDNYIILYFILCLYHNIMYFYMPCIGSICQMQHVKYDKDIKYVNILNMLKFLFMNYHLRHLE